MEDIICAQYYNYVYILALHYVIVACAVCNYEMCYAS